MGLKKPLNQKDSEASQGGKYANMQIRSTVTTVGISIMIASLLATAFMPVPTFWLGVLDAVVAIILLATTCVR